MRLRAAGASIAPFIRAKGFPDVAIAYLPNENFLYDLHVETSQCEEGVTSRLKIPPEVRDETGALHPGLWVTLVDAVGGRLGMRAAYPDFVATTQATVQLTRPTTGSVAAATGRLLRRGRSTLAVDLRLSEVRDGVESDIGLASATFQIIPTPPGSEGLFASLDETPGALGPPGPRAALAFRERVGLRVVDAASGHVEVALSAYVTNHLEALQGGIHAILAEAAAEGALREASGAPLQVHDLAIQYLSLGRKGPFRTHTEIVRADARTGAARVEIADEGAGGRIVAIGSIGAACAEDGPLPGGTR